MSEYILFSAVHKLAAVTGGLADYEMDQPFYWRAHGEGVRMALLGSYHDLRELAVELAGQRAAGGPARTRAQRVLAPYHAAYRDLQAVLVGVDGELWDASPGAGEWPLRDVLRHIVAAERVFYARIVEALRQQRHGESAAPLPGEQVEQIVDGGQPKEGFEAATEAGPPALLAYYDRLHKRIIGELVGLSDHDLKAPSPWWEGEPLPVAYRLHRLDAHLRQHTVQAEKALAVLDHGATEARRLLRPIFAALADVEASTFGAPELGREQREARAALLAERAEAVAGRVAQARVVGEAVTAGERERVEALLSDDPALAGVTGPRGLSLVLEACYRREHEIAERLAQDRERLSIFEAAALGRLETVKEWLGRWDGFLSHVNRDGFMPLHLAAFFGHESPARWLIEQGADVNAAAENQARIRPLHAAAAGGSPSIVRALLEAGADANARQEGGFTALHSAAQQGDAEMARLLLEHGADPALADDEGRSAADLARAAGHEEVANLVAV